MVMPENPRWTPSPRRNRIRDADGVVHYVALMTVGGGPVGEVAYTTQCAQTILAPATTSQLDDVALTCLCCIQETQRWD